MTDGVPSGVENTASDGGPPSHGVATTSSISTGESQKSAAHTQPDERSETANGVGDGQDPFPMDFSRLRKFDAREIFSHIFLSVRPVNPGENTPENAKLPDTCKSFARSEERQIFDFAYLPVPYSSYLPRPNPYRLQYLRAYARKFKEGLEAMKDDNGFHPSCKRGPKRTQIAERRCIMELTMRLMRKKMTDEEVWQAINRAMPSAPLYVRKHMAKPGSKMFEKYMAAAFFGVQPDFTMLQLIYFARWQISPDMLAAKIECLEDALMERFPFYRGGSPYFPLGQEQEQFQCPDSGHSMRMSLHSHMLDIFNDNFDCHERLFKIVETTVPQIRQPGIHHLWVQASAEYVDIIFDTFGLVAVKGPPAHATPAQGSSISSLLKLPDEILLKICNELFRDFNDKVLITHARYTNHVEDDNAVLHYDDATSSTAYSTRSVFLSPLRYLLSVAAGCSRLVPIVRESFFGSTTFCLQPEDSLFWLHGIGTDCQELLQFLMLPWDLIQSEEHLFAIVDILARCLKLQGVTFLLKEGWMSDTELKSCLTKAFNGKVMTKLSHFRGVKEVSFEIEHTPWSRPQMTDDFGQPFFEKEKRWLIGQMTATKIGKGNIPALAAKPLRKAFLRRWAIKTLEEMFYTYEGKESDVSTTKKRDFYASFVEKKMREHYYGNPST